MSAEMRVQLGQDLLGYDLERKAGAKHDIRLELSPRAESIEFHRSDRRMDAKVLFAHRRDP